jgi:DNA primase
MSQDDIQKIKNRLGIEEIIGSYIKLERSGNNLKAKCPFHNEKTPSFYVSPDRDSYYCFGCGVKGDIFNFVQEYEGLDFLGALKVLADRAGIVLSKNQDFKNDTSKILYQILEDATKFFENNLNENKEALVYLESRGLKESDIKKWRIGYAKNDWRSLLDFLKSKNHDQDNIEKVGLIKKGDKGDYYDRFRSRIIFPINDGVGRPIAFTGRIFGQSDKETAKYLNSPETVLFDKSRTLFGFDLAKNFIRKLNFSILVEGQMDTVMAHQAGYGNTIASSGTALTVMQLEMLNRFSNKMVIAYDVDKAGINASKKAWQIALSLGMDVKLANLKNDDPAEVIKKNKNDWRLAIKESKHIIEFLTINLVEKESDNRKRLQIASQEVIPYLASIKSSLDQAHFVDFLAEKLDIEKESVWNEVTSYKPTNDKEIKNILTENKANDLEINSLEKRLFGIYFWIKSKNDSVKTEHLESELKSKIIPEKFTQNLNFFQKNENELIFETEKLYKDEKNLDRDIKELLKNLNLKILLEKRISLRKELVLTEKKDSQKADQIWKEINEISKQINQHERDD